MTETVFRLKRHLTSFQIMILGFAGVILLGALVLMLPIATVQRVWTPFHEALFTSTSAVCVTGLVVQDTGSYWSAFGQTVILLLIQIGGLCLKSGNAVLLKGGREALHTNEALFDIMNDASVATGLPDGWCGLLTTREDVSVMLKMDEDIDLIIPRGSNAFVRYIMENSSIPVLGHSDGVCHVYVDADCDAQMAARIVVDAKTQYPAACNAAEIRLDA